ncbi:MAG TPA: hypothetical protein VL068_04405, partial [Microthrixaceae bacterium]|nr:hypothetical protein [Microthrixaceae bacterium]
MITKRFGATTLVLVTSVLFTSVVAAQTDPGFVPDPIDASTTTTSTTTTTPVATGSSTSVPGTSTSTSTTVPTPPTTVYVPPVPPELVGDPRLPFLVDPGEDDGLDIPVAQLSFDPLSVGVLPERVAEAKLVLLAAEQAQQAATLHAAELKARVAKTEARVSELSSSRADAVKKAATARKRLRDQAVVAYVRGRSDPKLTLVELKDATDIGVAREYLGVVLDNQNNLAREYEKLRKALSKDEGRLAASLGVEQSRESEARAQLTQANKAVVDATQQLAAYEAGAHAYIEGFVFPVAAEVEFIDSWGYPRMTGTSYEHWHQGTDIFAPYGASVIASE